MTEAEVNRLPDPDLFRDALFLAAHGTWSPRDLDEADAMLVALVRKLKNARRQQG